MFICQISYINTLLKKKKKKWALVPYRILMILSINFPSLLEFFHFIYKFQLETYWTYEVCHGKHVKQYHEERDGKKIKKQEYFLGRWDPAMQDELSKY